MASVRIKTGPIVLGLCLVFTQSAAPYIYPLSEESVREAYFLGRTTDLEKLAKFLGQYVYHFPYPVNGPYVEEVEFRTPYEQIVRRSWENSAGYSAQQAQKDYAAQPNLVVVRVLIYLTPTYAGTTTHPSGSRGQPGERPEDFWREFAIRVVQGQTIEPKKVSGTRFRRGRGLGGAEVLLEFDAAQFDPGTVRVEVTGPDGKTLQAKFDLNPIR